MVVAATINEMQRVKAGVDLGGCFCFALGADAGVGTLEAIAQSHDLEVAPLDAHRSADLNRSGRQKKPADLRGKREKQTDDLNHGTIHVYRV